MLRDAQLMLADQQAVTTAVATPSTNYYDTLGPAPSDLGIGEPLYVVALVRESVTSSAGANVTIALQTDDNTSFSSATTLLTSAAIPKATAVAGYVFFKQRLPLGCERYIRALITPDTTALTAGKFDVFITANVDAIPTTPHPRAVYSVA